MQTPRLRIALLGGVPSVLGGGGLEVQVARTCSALRELGHDARPVHAWDASDDLDVVHAFNHSGEVLRYLEFWRRNPAALVFSPVAVVAPGSAVTRLRLASHIPLRPIPGRALRVLARQADMVVGLTAWERAFMIRQAGIPHDRCVVVGNGVDAQPLANRPADLGDPYLVSVGTVSARKRQANVARALAGSGLAYVVIGGHDGPGADEFRDAVHHTGGRWFGEIHDAGLVCRVVHDAAAFVLLSDREGQSLAVLEALSVGTPVIVSDLPAHRELAEQFPGWVSIVRRPEDVRGAAEAIVAREPTGPVPAVDTWNDVAERLVTHAYEPAMRSPARTGQER